MNDRQAASGNSIEAVLACAARLAPIAGVTRIADITGLDDIGFPVVSVMRPAARSLSVSSGKGSTLAAAHVSGLMEALELFHAESFKKWLPRAELAPSIPVADLDRLPRLSKQPRPEQHPDSLRMTVGADIVTGDPVAVPYDLVHADFRPQQVERGGFLFSTTGLAGGASADAAILHGLCEVIESDAVALLLVRDRTGSLRSETPIDWAGVNDPAALSIYDSCRERGIDVYAFDITTDVGVPVYYCRLIDRRTPGHRIRPATDGSASHPCATQALRSALEEALQVRLILIAGARDDLAIRDYLADAPPSSYPRLAKFKPLFGMPSDAPAAACVAWICKRLASAGFDQTIAVDLASRSEELFFFRVIVPGLEAYPHSRHYAPGSRARKAGNCSCELSFLSARH